MPRIEDAYDTGSPLRKRRIECGVSIRALAQATGVPATRIQRLEDPNMLGHKVQPRVRDLARLAWALGVTSDDLVDPRWLDGYGLGRPTPREIWTKQPASRPQD